MCEQQRRSAAVSKTLWLLAAGLIALYLVVFALVVATRLAEPLDEIAYGESWLLDGARQLARGEGLYSPATALPLVQYAYAPLYYGVVGLLIGFVGDHGYTLGRAVSVISVGLGTLGLALSVRQLTGRLSMGLLAAGVFLTQNLTVLMWAPLQRVDGFALALSLLGLYAVGSGRWPVGAILFIAALLTKQTFFVAPLAAAVALWPCRANLLGFAALLVVGAGAFGVATNVITNGWFAWHVVTANANEPDLYTFASLVGSFVQYNGLAVLACLVSFTFPARPGERMWRAYLVGSLATLVMLTKLGASSNYWLEVSAAAAVCLALAADRLGPFAATRLIAPTVVVGALLTSIPAYQATATAALLTLGDLIAPGPTQYISLISDAGAPATLRVPVSFVEHIAREPGDVLTDNSGLAVAAGKRIVYEFQIFQLLQSEGVWSDEPIQDAIAARRFGLVVLMHPLETSLDQTRWTAAVQRALLENYAAAGTESAFWLYRPRS